MLYSCFEAEPFQPYFKAFSGLVQSYHLLTGVRKKKKKAVFKTQQTKQEACKIP